MTRRWRLGLATAAAVCLLSPAGFSQAPDTRTAERQASEYDIKAAFLLNFARFVEWPGASTLPFPICIVGDDPFGTALDQLVEGETVQGRRIIVRRAARVAESCLVVFARPKDTARAIAEAGPGVLTVGEGDRFVRDGGMIAFVVENRRVRFDINQKAVAAAGLQISSKLLNVARAVKR